MTDPYRDSALDLPADSPRDPGIVGDIVAQFADPKAFLRELVQNAIDAGTPSVEIELEYDEPVRRMRVSVRDRGEGMTREIVENQLLVLFRSTKEQDRTKIGKFGIGFVSVLAPEPEVVVVQTARAGRRITLHLYRDLSYELFDAGPATQTGTTVELEIALERGEVERFVRECERSLERWCRHASVPIDLAIRTPAVTANRRVDRPLSIDGAIVEVRGTRDDGQLSVTVALTADATPYVGFFNHGLTLYETREPLVGRLAIKIQDPRLGHTISRDDVRRDEHFEQALGFARYVARTELVRAASNELYKAAEAHDLAQHRALLVALAAAGIELSRDALHLPVAEPIGGKRSLPAGALVEPYWTSERPSKLTAALAEAGTPVVLAQDPDEVGRLLGETVRSADRELTCITPIDPTDDDEALLALLADILDAAHRPPDAIVLATLIGARADRLSIAGTHAELPHVVDREEAARDPFALLRRRVLVLSVAHPQVRAARRGDPVLAASHLARAVLLQHRLLNEKRSRRIVEHALARVGVDR
ncbi:MAG TPA: ATP-binding protein [Kofleriaceae bacterium]|nr:ATP-binding protein [Kofleriaceae bacterium]